ncbi:transmembrane protein 267 [Orussus abietinus]|uniref:transmembrane protein 267 n=1 Tax=Orussus abietinus TaxID=222816 RepID=UPI000625EA61|nr:transmembrane protein 267 [Orussus abietinus]
MFFSRRDVILRVLLTSSISICSYVGDQILKNGKNQALRAISDNLTHAIVGGLSWSLIVILSKKSLSQNIFRILSCFLVSSFVDLDHFIVARSWKLHDATHLERRPFLHCSTLPIIIWLFLLSISIMYNLPNTNDYAWIILAGFLSHHIRDATRRGMWFCPIGSTKPIPYPIYLCTSMAFPYILAWLMYMVPGKTGEYSTMTFMV